MDRRLTVVVGGAGFGKSTLAARVATKRRSAWYALDAGDRHLGALTSGIVAALRVALPDLPADLAGPIEGSIEAADDAAIYLRILERDPFDEGAHLGLVAALVAAGRHGEARRRYGFYATKMEEISVEAAPFPARGSGS
jgi:hypothetical protein